VGAGAVVADWKAANQAAFVCLLVAFLTLRLGLRCVARHPAEVRCEAAQAQGGVAMKAIGIGESVAVLACVRCLCSCQR
jgi:hypothetical protein